MEYTFINLVCFPKRWGAWGSKVLSELPLFILKLANWHSAQLPIFSAVLVLENLPKVFPMNAPARHSFHYQPANVFWNPERKIEMYLVHPKAPQGVVLELSSSSSGVYKATWTTATMFEKFSSIKNLIKLLQYILVHASLDLIWHGLSRGRIFCWQLAGARLAPNVKWVPCWKPCLNLALNITPSRRHSPKDVGR